MVSLFMLLVVIIQFLNKRVQSCACLFMYKKQNKEENAKKWNYEKSLYTRDSTKTHEGKQNVDRNTFSFCHVGRFIGWWRDFSLLFFLLWLDFVFFLEHQKQNIKKAKLRYCSLEMNKWAKYNIYSSFSVIEWSWRKEGMLHHQ